jgi:hypothetical protein
MFFRLFAALLLLSAVALPRAAEAAWSALGAMGGAGNATANQTPLQMTVATTSPSAGNVVIVWVGKDNTLTGDTSGTEISVADSSGTNVYQRVAEYTNGNAGAQTGCTVAMFYSVLTTGLTAGSSTITATLGGTAANNDAQGMTAHAFSMSTGNAVTITGTPSTLSNDAADPGAITSPTVASAAYLWVHGLCGEGPSTDAYTWDADYTKVATNGSSSGGAAGNVHVTGGFRIFTGTTDTVDVTSTTADRDYAQVLGVLLETTQTGWGPLLGGSRNQLVQ